MDDEEGSYSDDYASDDDSQESYESEELQQEEQEHHQSKRSRGEGDSKFALPTKEEQLHLRETENLMRTNLLKLQVDEMLAEIRDVKAGMKSSVSIWLEEFQTQLQRIGQSLSGTQISLQWLHDRQVHGVNLDGFHVSDTVLTYLPPDSVTIIGSNAFETATKPYLSIDMALSIPHACFEAK